MGLGMGEPRTKADGEQGREYLPYVPGILERRTGALSKGAQPPTYSGTGAEGWGLGGGGMSGTLV